MMLGYVDADLDHEAFDDEGYLRTGDLGTVDAAGYVRITGRLKDVVIRNGENVSTAEVEVLLRAMDVVADAAVIGLPDARTGERVCAVIETTPGSVAPECQCGGHMAGGAGTATYRLARTGGVRDVAAAYARRKDRQDGSGRSVLVLTDPRRRFRRPTRKPPATAAAFSR